MCVKITSQLGLSAIIKPASSYKNADSQKKKKKNKNWMKWVTNDGGSQLKVEWEFKKIADAEIKKKVMSSPCR